MAVRLDLVVSGAADAFADAADGTDRLASRSRISLASVAPRTPDLRSHNGLCVPPARAPLHTMVNPRSAKRRTGAAPNTAGRYSGARCLVGCSGTGRAVGNSSAR